MGRKKAEELLGMVVDGAILIGNRPRVVLPKFLDEVLTEDEREKVSKCFNPLNCSALLESESWASKEDPKLGELASRLMEALRAKYRRTWREDHLEAAGLGFWALHLCPDLLRSARLALPPEHRWVLSSLGLAFEARQPDVLSPIVDAWTKENKSSTPSHNERIALEYRRELVVRWCRSILEHAAEGEPPYAAQAANAAERIGNILRELAAEDLFERSTVEECRSLELLEQLKANQDIPLGFSLTEELVGLRSQKGQMGRFLGAMKPYGFRVRSHIAKRFGVKPPAVTRALTRVNAKETLLDGL